MPKIELVQPKSTEVKTKKRVAAYARVSIDSEQLFHEGLLRQTVARITVQENGDPVFRLAGGRETTWQRT